MIIRNKIYDTLVMVRLHKEKREKTFFHFQHGILLSKITIHMKVAFISICKYMKTLVSTMFGYHINKF